MAASPLCDGPRFARNLDAAFRDMWRAWCREQSGKQAAVRIGNVVLGRAESILVAP
jgi:hypothetical protein